MSELTCRGSIMLGTACGTCSKCEREIKTMHERLNKVAPEPQGSPQGMVGWSCPKCGRGNSPFTSTCPCVPLPVPVVTC